MGQGQLLGDGPAQGVAQHHRPQRPGGQKLGHPLGVVLHLLAAGAGGGEVAGQVQGGHVDLLQVAELGQKGFAPAARPVDQEQAGPGGVKTAAPLVQADLASGQVLLPHALSSSYFSGRRWLR